MVFRRLSLLLLIVTTHIRHGAMRRSFLVMRTRLDTKAVDPFAAARTSAMFRLPVVILVSPFSAANVGSVSRAMLNWGLSELRVVDPRCDLLSDEAKTLAVGSVAVLEHATTYATLQDAVKDLHRVFATTARRRDLNQIVHTAHSAAYESLDYLQRHDGCAVGVVFGRERGGLTNDELLCADSTIHIPAFEEYDVLNLAQAVNIIGYEIFQRYATLRGDASGRVVRSSTGNIVDVGDVLRLQQEHHGDVHGTDGSGSSGKALKMRSVDQPANQEEINVFMSRLNGELRRRGYRSVSQNNNSPAAPLGGDAGDGDDVQFRSLKGIFRRTCPTRSEVNVLQGMLTTLLKEPLNTGNG